MAEIILINIYINTTNILVQVLNKTFLSSDSLHCCGFTEAMIRLALSAVVGVATVIIVVYDIRFRRAEKKRKTSQSDADW